MKIKLPLLLAIALISLKPAFSAEYTIQFGGATGMRYDPDSLHVNVGDIITWVGDFLAHPLASTTVPDGAQPFSKNTGTEFSITIQFPGTYRFHCSSHFFDGKIVATQALTVPSVENMKLNIYPTVTKTDVTVSGQNFDDSKVKMHVTNLLGEVAIPPVVLANGSTKVDMANLTPGVYIITIRRDNHVLKTQRISKE